MYYTLLLFSCFTGWIGGSEPPSITALAAGKAGPT